MLTVIAESRIGRSKTPFHPGNAGLTDALTAHAQAIGVLPTPSPMSSEERFSAMMVIARRAAQRPVFDPRRPDEIIGYNALGLPE
jgi:hypothetical protein